MQEQLDFLQSILSVARERGWTDSRLSLNLTEDSSMPLHVSYGLLTPKLGELELEAIYISSTAVDIHNSESVLSRLPTVSEYRTRKLFDHISAAESLGEQLRLPADFLNPLLVLAEQLRTNILPKPGLSAELNDNIPF